MSKSYTGETLPTYQTFAAPGFIQLRSPDNLTNPGYTFAGWRDSNGDIWPAGFYFGYGTEYSGMIVFDATWVSDDASNIVTITYMGNGHTGGSIPASQSVNTPGSITLRSFGNMTRTGHTPGGWRSNDGAVVYSINQSLWYPAGASGPVTLHAEWIPTSNAFANITYNGNGHSGGTVPLGHTLGFRGTVQLRNPGTLARTGFTFGGWRNHNNILFQPGDQVWSSPGDRFTAYWRQAGGQNPTLIGRSNINQWIVGDIVTLTAGSVLSAGQLTHNFTGWILPDNVILLEGFTPQSNTMPEGGVEVGVGYVRVLGF